MAWRNAGRPALGGYLRSARTAAELRRRRAALLEGLERHCREHLRFDDSRAGMHLVGWLPDWPAPAVQELVLHARARGLGLHPIGPHYLAEPAPPGLLLGFAALSPKQLQSATAQLGRCLREVALTFSSTASPSAPPRPSSRRRAT